MLNSLPVHVEEKGLPRCDFPRRRLDGRSSHASAEGKGDHGEETQPHEEVGKATERARSGSALLNEATDAELNMLLYGRSPHERRSMEKVRRVASARLKQPKAVWMTIMLVDYNIERHPKLSTTT